MKQRAGRALQLPWAVVPSFVARAVFRALMALTWEHYCSTDLPSLCFAAVALKNHGANEAERDGDRDSSPAPGTAVTAVPEGELLLQVSGFLPLADAFKGIFLSSPSQLLRAFPKSSLLRHLFQDILVKLVMRREGAVWFLISIHIFICQDSLLP